MRAGTELLAGVTVPLVTPMDAAGRPSVKEAVGLLDAMHHAGVRQLMLLGSNGEGPLIPTDALTPFVTGVVARWRSLGEGVVTVNVTAPGTLDALARARVAAEAGVDALVLSPPIYFHHRPDEIVGHFAALGELGIPVIAYNAPRYSNPITPEVFDELLGLDHLVGIKDSSGDLDLLARFVAGARGRSGFAVGQGAETKLADALELGAVGVVPGVANLAPALSLNLVSAYQAGEGDELRRLQALVTELTKLHTIRPGTPAVKAILADRSLCTPYVAPPLRRCDSAESAALRDFIAQHQLHLLTPTKG